jgi:uncharacterized Zn finger protein
MDEKWKILNECPYCGSDETKIIRVNDPGGYADLTLDISGCFNCGCVYLARIPRKQNPCKTGKEYKNEKW